MKPTQPLGTTSPHECAAGPEAGTALLHGRAVLYRFILADALAPGTWLPCYPALALPEAEKGLAGALVAGSPLGRGGAGRRGAVPRLWVPLVLDHCAYRVSRAQAWISRSANHIRGNYTHIGSRLGLGKALLAQCLQSLGALSYYYILYNIINNTHKGGRRSVGMDCFKKNGNRSVGKTY